jgi:hypothetical protein
MNASQPLEVAIKVFVNQDQEAKQEADRKMKRKVDLLAAAFVDQSGGPWWVGLNRGQGSHHGW